MKTYNLLGSQMNQNKYYKMDKKPYTNSTNYQVRKIQSSSLNYVSSSMF